MYKLPTTDPSSPLPQTAYGEGPEVDHRPQQPPPVSEQVQVLPLPPPVPGAKIVGLRRQTFWVGLILLVVVVAAAVGGGVGGSLAVQEAKSVTNNVPSLKKLRKAAY